MVMRALTRKLLRDVWQTRGQGLAIALVIAAGVAMFVGYLSTFDSLDLARRTYYDRFKFADVFVSLKRAPLAVAADLAAIPGVVQASPRVVADVALDMPDLAEPATGRLLSIAARRVPALNEPFIRRGRRPETSGEVLAGEAFALAHRLDIGDVIAATINGRRRQLQITGIALSPEYVYSIRPGEMIPDNARFGILWMDHDALSAALDMEGAFNDASFALMRGTSESDVVAAVDRLVARYGGVGAITRTHQISNWFIENELKQLRTVGFVIPVIFLSVSAFLLNIVLTRLVAVQREQIAALKALGYTHLEIGTHYVSWAIAITLLGGVIGSMGGIWLGNAMTNLYNDFFRFPTLRFVLAPALLVEAGAISLLTGALGALSAVAQAVRLPPAEAMRPQPPALHHLTWLDRAVPRSLAPPTVRMIVRNLNRQPVRTGFSALGVALAVAILIVGMFSLDAIEMILDVQFNVVQRQHYTIAFVQPVSTSALHEVAHLPGVLAAEPLRAVPARITAGHRSRQTVVTGIANGARLQRVVDTSLAPVPLPPEGLVLSRNLADILHAQAGDAVRVELLEGSRPERLVAVTAVVDEFMGTSAYMELAAVNRLLKEGPRLSGAALLVDGSQPGPLYRLIKRMPGVAGISSTRTALKSFRQTIAHNMNVMIFFNILFSSVIAFGVVYNAARIAVSERSHDLASLRVLGFTRAEISVILLGELAVIGLLAIPLGLLLGYGLAALFVQAFDTELYRIPLVILPRTYAFSAVTTIVAGIASGLIVRHRLDRLDLVAVLKTRE